MGRVECGGLVCGLLFSRVINYVMKMHQLPPSLQGWFEVASTPDALGAEALNMVLQAGRCQVDVPEGLMYCTRTTCYILLNCLLFGSPPTRTCWCTDMHQLDSHPRCRVDCVLSEVVQKCAKPSHKVSQRTRIHVSKHHVWHV